MVRLYATEAAKRLTSIFEKKLRDPQGGKALDADGEFDASGALDEMFGE